VNLQVNGLSSSNNIFQFAATTPGAYCVLDIGRFVRSFKAFDANGEEISTFQSDVNRWQLSEPEKIKEIQYEVEAMWQNPDKQSFIPGMLGSAISHDYVLLNSHAVFGYFKGLEHEDLILNIEYPEDWMIGTPLITDEPGSYFIHGYNELTANPFLLGKLEKCEFKVENTNIKVYTYSKSGGIKAADLKNDIDSALRAISLSLGELPVEYYTFIFHFEDEKNTGALEFPHGALFTMDDQPYRNMRAMLIGDEIHEFFHLVSPLGIRSEILDNFDYSTPTPSEHLWLYEGVTEWASDIIQLRGNMMDLSNYLSEMRSKLIVDELNNPNYSLRDIALTCYTDSGYAQNSNIYHRGALVAGLLDIKLLELSGGKKGLMDVLNQLREVYKPGTPFSEVDLLELFVEMTYPDIRDFFDKYVIHTNPLPLAEYFEYLGIGYQSSVITSKKTKSLGFVGFFLSDNKLRYKGVGDELKEMGLKEGDELISLNGQLITLENVREASEKLMQLPVGASYKATLRRDGVNIVLNCKIIETDEIMPHVFTLLSGSTQKQLALRETWMENRK